MCTCYSERLPLLLDINSALMTKCSPASARAVIIYTDNLNTLRNLENITESDCPISK